MEAIHAQVACTRAINVCFPFCIIYDIQISCEAEIIYGLDNKASRPDTTIYRYFFLWLIYTHSRINLVIFFCVSFVKNFNKRAYNTLDVVGLSGGLSFYGRMSNWISNGICRDLCIFPLSLSLVSTLFFISFLFFYFVIDCIYST